MSGDLLDFYDRLGREEDERLREAAPTSHRSSSTMQTLVTSGEDGGADYEFSMAVEQIAPQFRAYVEMHYRRGIAMCESPIERRLFPWLLCQRYRSFACSPAVLTYDQVEGIRPFSVAVVPQMKIGRYRVDFALAARRAGPVRFVIVECDGRDFHKDVRKDVARDTDRVLDVLPFAGWEIWKDPEATAATASAGVTNAWAKTNGATARKFAGEGLELS